MRSAEAKRGYAQARLRALWPEIVGTDLAAVTMPVRLARNRGPAGGLLTLAVSGAHAALIQMQLPALRERVNAALGPGTVGQSSSRMPRRVSPMPRAHPGARSWRQSN